MKSFDTLPLDVNFGHLLTGSNFSDRPNGGQGGGDFDDDKNNDRDNDGGGERGRFTGGGFSERLSHLGMNFKPSRYGHRCELPGNYPVFTVVMVIYTFVWKISIITLPPDCFNDFIYISIKVYNLSRRTLG